MKTCIFGGQFGSEGKGSVSEYWIKNFRSTEEKIKVIAIGENAPNSGHTCSLGKTRNVPAVSYFADEIWLGPDASVSLAALLEDLCGIFNVTGRRPPVFIHENASMVTGSDVKGEADVVKRVSSTGSGSGLSRVRKYFDRLPEATVKILDNLGCNTRRAYFGEQVKLVTTSEYLQMVKNSHRNCDDWIFECSQGLMLDPNFGYFPFVTSRSTLPHVALARNGLHTYKWDMVGVYRTYPIRTGGPSGPTGGRELSWEEINIVPEIATVTKRVRRVFEFSMDDFVRSVGLAQPSTIVFTHCDYLDALPLWRWIKDKRQAISAMLSAMPEFYMSREAGRLEIVP